MTLQTETAPAFVEKTPLERYFAPEKPSLVGLTRAQLGKLLGAIGVPEAQRKMRVQQLWHWIYFRGFTSFDKMTSLSKELRAALLERGAAGEVVTPLEKDHMGDAGATENVALHPVDEPGHVRPVDHEHLAECRLVGSPVRGLVAEQHEDVELSLRETEGLEDTIGLLAQEARGHEDAQHRLVRRRFDCGRCC